MEKEPRFATTCVGLTIVHKRLIAWETCEVRSVSLLDAHHIKRELQQDISEAVKSNVHRAVSVPQPTSVELGT